MITISILLVCIGLFLWFLVYWISNSATMEIPTAYAGSPKPQVPCQITFELPKRRVDDYIGKEKIDLSYYYKIIIKGHSLEKLGIDDNSIVYCSKWEFGNKECSLNQLQGRFIILNIDNERTTEEHPLDPNYFHSNGKKARKALRVIPIPTGESQLSEISNLILKDIKESEEKKSRLLEEIKQKYKFASKYYSERGDKDLIMSLTYRHNGKDLGFSFHSPRFVYGVIEYIGSKNYFHQVT